ncbi:hypothetical protein BpHYR1_039325 [Brachionus plicatilis]|uniref:Uncharacterized protein n=1 Tax=Brachionus plicatilis TaxID=10195 RepID=A0A3M7R679_BRAPC|nr:hypothetical protein BpHYR1_039325 [Brachionus plicatilis]
MNSQICVLDHIIFIIRVNIGSLGTDCAQFHRQWILGSFVVFYGMPQVAVHATDLAFPCSRIWRYLCWIRQL